MGLSRLENFLKNARGNILYVSPNDLDSTDSVENRGNSLTRPFKTIQRALIEAARFSYQRGLNNDRFGQTTILLYPGDHIVDNRPGWIPDGSDNYRLRDGTTSDDLPPWDLETIYDLTNPDNALYKMNSVHGGVILPRGTSIVGLDLRKTKIRPKYVPNPENDNIERSAIFRVTGACYLWQFTILDADPNGVCYKDYTRNTFVPNFSHHKLTAFEYADGVNNVKINDSFQTYEADRTDLDMYYEKIGLVYGTASGREIQPDYPSSSLDIQPKIDEYRIVGSTGQSVGITSIKAGDGSISSTTITVTTASSVDGLDVDTPIRINGITADGYDGQYVVAEKVSGTQFKYEVQNAPTSALPSVTGSTVSLQSDTVTSASPYIFNISMRSVFGLCGMLADGDKATGFKSMVVAQFTGIGLQKDDKAFVKYNDTTGVYDDSTVPGNETLSTNSRSVFKPSYANFHIKSTNNSFIQCVSIFAIGYAEHFVAENGGDMSITNSNSNFGARSLIASGFRKDAFTQDDQGYITHIIPPKEIPITESAIEFDAIDIEKTVGVASTGHLYLYNQKNLDVPPENVLEGYRIGARSSENLYVLIPSGGTSVEFKSRVVMPKSTVSSEKKSTVAKSVAGINSITGSTITLTQAHSFENAESVRVFSDNGRLPDGLETNTVYYVITDANTSSGITTNVDIQLAKTETDAKNASELTINNLGGTLSIVSRVSDKNSGDIGHPIQYNSTEGQWYINVSTATTENQLYADVAVGLGTTALGTASPRSFIKRKTDARNAVDTTYRIRYVIPASIGGAVARPPSDAFIIQESNTSIGSTSSEVELYFGSGSLSHINQVRNFRFIADANWSSNTANVATELPHDLTVGSQVEILNVKSSNNATGVANTGFNGTYTVTGISSAKEFTVGINTDPGSFQSDTTTRDTNLPYFKRKRYNTNFIIQGSQEIQPFVSGQQDGIYYFTVINASNKPAVAPFNTQEYTQSVINLYPQRDKDTPVSDPDPSISFARSTPIGEVIVDDVKKSITRETVDKFVADTDIGIGLTDIVTGTGGTVHTIHTEIDHGLNAVTRVSIASSGTNYGAGANATYYNARLVSIGSSVTGKHATAKVNVDATGGITAVQIMDGGSAYGIGNTMEIVGIATTGSTHTPAVVTVAAVSNNVGDVIRITGVTSETYKPYNTLYRVTDIPVGSAKSFTAQSDPAITDVTTSGIGTDVLTSASAYLTGQELKISSFTFDPTSGIATVTTNSAHGLRVNNKVKISTGISTATAFNGDFVIKQNINLTSFTINVGASATTTTVAAGSSMFALRGGIQSNDGIPTLENEQLNGRMVPQYAGITTTLASGISDATATTISLTNVANLGLRIGDYLTIDDEIVRVKTAPANPATNPITVFRAVLGTRATIHDNGSVVRRIKPFPVELRRHSINRASGHTFEYVGFGPGNYSTALPDRQDRSRTAAEELLSQSTKQAGGVNFFTGMNDKGISYSGNKKLSSVTGQEEIFDSPIRTVTGEDISKQKSINLINATDAVVTNTLRVDGGDEGKAASEFTGPVIFTNKITSTSARGVEVNSLFLQGESTVSRKHTVGIATPTDAGTPGDVVYYENPEQGKYVGWVYTVNKDWRRFGNVSLSKISDIYIFDQVGIASTTLGSSALRIGAGSSLFAVDSDGVGIATTANSKALRVVGDTDQDGNVNITGIVTATAFHGDGNNLTNLNATATGWGQVEAGLGTGLYNSALTNVGVGTTVPKYNLHLGHPGLGRTALWVESNSEFRAGVAASDISVSGIITAANFRLNNSSSGQVNAGIVTAGTLVVGTAVSTSGSNVGFGTGTPRAKVDIEGSLRLKSYSEAVQAVTSSSGNVTLDLSVAQNFTVTTSEAISQFTITNTPNDVTTFTVKILQGSTAFSVGIDTFKNSGGSTIPVRWPGGVLPVVTQVADKTDIYSFKSFDSCATLYGIVGGQNFS